MVERTGRAVGKKVFFWLFFLWWKWLAVSTSTNLCFHFIYLSMSCFSLNLYHHCYYPDSFYFSFHLFPVLKSCAINFLHNPYSDKAIFLLRKIVTFQKIPFKGFNYDAKIRTMLSCMSNHCSSIWFPNIDRVSVNIRYFKT